MATQLALVDVPSLVRDPLERHYTPIGLAELAVARLCELWPTPSALVEPSVGGGAFLSAMLERWVGARSLACDLDPNAGGLEHADRGDWADAGLWLAELAELEALDRCAWVVGNPPFSQAQSHIRAARRNGLPLVAFILPGDLPARAASTGWPGLFAEHPCDVYPVDGRPWPRNVREVGLYVWGMATHRSGALYHTGDRLRWGGQW